MNDLKISELIIGKTYCAFDKNMKNRKVIFTMQGPKRGDEYKVYYSSLVYTRYEGDTTFRDIYSHDPEDRRIDLSERTIREANHYEINWLNTCSKINKGISFEESKKYLTSDLKSTDLIPGEIYHVHEPDVIEMVFQYVQISTKIGGDLDYDRVICAKLIVCENNPIKNYFEKGKNSVIYITKRNCRPANDEELIWLKVCDKENKFISKEDSLKLLVEHDLSKEEFLAGNKFKIAYLSTNGENKVIEQEGDTLEKALEQIKDFKEKHYHIEL